MFSCVNAQDDARVESISRFWLLPQNEALLRKLTIDHALLCPKCKDSVIYKNGMINRAHFSHRACKDQRECSLAKERRSATESRVLSIIYEELEKHPHYDVQVDVMLDDAEHTIDLLVSKGEQVIGAYWILDRGRREDTLSKLTAPLKSRNIPHQFIFTGEAITESSNNYLSMSASVDREKRYTAQFDLEEIDVESGGEYGHLQYFDEVNGVLKVFRGIYESEYSLLRTIPMDRITITEKGEMVCYLDLDYAKESSMWIHAGSSKLFNKILLCLYCRKPFSDYSVIVGEACVCHKCLPKHNIEQQQKQWDW